MDTIKHIGIIGTGMIATSLAVLTTSHGYKTTLFAMNDELEAASRDTYKTNFKQLTDKKVMTDSQAEICSRYLNYTQSYDALSDTDIIFESVVEVLDIKHSVYSEIEKSCPDVKVICSVSSAIETDDLAKGLTKYKDRIIVTHPFYPPHMVPFFELCKGTDTSEEAVKSAFAVLEALDRKPVLLKKSAPGFIGNRLQFALWREALNIVESGIADPKDVDTCLMYSFCPRYTSIGMFEHFDNGGLELNRNVCKSLFPVLSDEKEVPKAITERIESGNLGVKTGEGFYNWEGVDMDAYRERVSAPYWSYFNWDFPKD